MLIELLLALATPPPTTTPLTKVIEDCHVAYVAYAYANDKGVQLEKMLASYPESEREAARLVCYVYGKGFKDGRKGVN